METINFWSTNWDGTNINENSYAPLNVPQTAELCFFFFEAFSPEIDKKYLKKLPSQKEAMNYP